MYSNFVFHSKETALKNNKSFEVKIWPSHTIAFWSLLPRVSHLWRAIGFPCKWYKDKASEYDIGIRHAGRAFITLQVHYYMLINSSFLDYASHWIPVGKKKIKTSPFRKETWIKGQVFLTTCIYIYQTLHHFGWLATKALSKGAYCHPSWNQTQWECICDTLAGYNETLSRLGLCNWRQSSSKQQPNGEKCMESVFITYHDSEVIARWQKWIA